MTNEVPSPSGHQFPTEDGRLSAAEATGALDDDVDANVGSNADDDRLSKLPPEEHDEDRTLGGGMLGQGGTAVNRGTGTLGGEAQGRDVEADDEKQAEPTVDDDLAFPTEPGGGTR
jgi:hypothetical protein